MQRFTAVRFDDHCGAELQAGFEVLGDWIRLDYVDHIFLQNPWFERMSCGSGAELRRFAGLAVEDAVVRSESALFDHRSRSDDLLARGAGFADFANIFVALICGVKEFSVSRRGLFADGEGTVNLRRVASVAHRQLGDHDTAFFECA